MEGEQNYLKNFFNSPKQIFAVLEKDGRFIFLNEHVVNTLKTSRDTLLGKYFWDFLYELDIERVKKHIKDTGTEGAQVFKSRLQAMDDEERWISWTAFMSEEKIYVTGHDVTVVQKERETLKIAQNRLRLLHQATSNPTQSLNEKVDRVLNLGILQLRMKVGIVSHVQGNVLKIFRSKSNGLDIQKGKLFDLKQTFDSVSLQSGNLIGIHDIKNSVYDEHPAHIVSKYESYLAVPLYIDKEIFGILSFASDEPKTEAFEVTDYDFVRLVGQWISSSLALLLANEQIAYTAAIVGSSEDAIVGQTKEGLISTWNSGAEELFQYKEKEIIGKQFSILIPEDKKEEREHIIGKVLKGQKVEHYDTLRRKKDGTLVDVSVTVSPIINEEDEIIGASAVLRDITREKQIDRAKTEFVSLASHQLRTPLSAINWYAELLRDGEAGKMTKQQKEFIDEIFEGNQRMVKLVNELLNVSRIDFGNFTIDPTNIDILEVSKSVVKELTPKITAKKLNVKEEYGSKKIEYFADPNILRIVIQNLVSNAVKYTPTKGKIIVKIQEQKETGKLLIEVSDTGYGIPEGEQSRIFSKLFRADNVKEMDTVGTGLGLYVLKSIVEESGGSVEFTSVLNEGSTFTVFLPLSGMKKKEGGKSLSRVTP
jgi:PAS domain S-box-containing protein